MEIKTHLNDDLFEDQDYTNLENFDTHFSPEMKLNWLHKDLHKTKILTPAHTLIDSCLYKGIKISSFHSEVLDYFLGIMYTIHDIRQESTTLKIKLFKKYTEFNRELKPFESFKKVYLLIDSRINTFYDAADSLDIQVQYGIIDDILYCSNLNDVKKIVKKYDLF